MLASLHSGSRLAGRAFFLDLTFFTILLFFGWLSQTIWFQNNPSLMLTAISLDLLITIPIIASFVFQRSRRFLPSLAFLFSAEFLFLLALSNPIWNLLSIVPAWQILCLQSIFGSVALIFWIATFHKIFKLCKESQNRHPILDRFGRIRRSTESVFGRNWLASIIATELTTFSFAIGPGQSKKLLGFGQTTPDGIETFSYHKKSGIGALLGCFAMVVLMELTAVHFLVESWSPVVAWILTASSFYLFYQIIAHYRSIFLLPIRLQDDRLVLKNGLFMKTEIPFREIQQIQVTQKTPTDSQKSSSKTHSFSLPVGHNVILSTSTDQNCSVLYGGNIRYRNLLIFVDEPDRFMQTVSAKIKDSKNIT